MRLKELPLRLPPLFAEACGYQGNARYVALCWIPELRELWWSDDGEATIGNARSFLLLCDHPATGEALEDYRSAATGEGLRPWLLIDRNRRTLSMGSPGTVWSAIASQAPGGRRGRRFAVGLRQGRELERAVRAWLDWMGKRARRV